MYALRHICFLIRQVLANVILRNITLSHASEALEFELGHGMKGNWFSFLQLIIAIFTLSKSVNDGVKYGVSFTKLTLNESLEFTSTYVTCE